MTVLPPPPQPSNQPTNSIDHIGGHIKNSINVPSSTLDVALPSLVRKLKDKKTVVFHCALSQVRGPKAAAEYMRVRQRLLKDEPLKHTYIGEKVNKSKAEAETGQEGEKEERDGEWKDVDEENGDETKGQQVFVLERGFEGWQEVYGKDERLTENYSEELWSSQW
jgi:Cdc25 family phosphatase